MLADRAGRLEDRPKRIQGELLRYDRVEVEPLLAELEQHGFIERYVVDGRSLIQIVAFEKHQNPHFREAPSLLPARPSTVQAEGQSQTSPSHSQDEPEESPGLASGQAQPGQVPAGLTPDSGLLTPDSKEKQAAPAEIPAEPRKAMTAKERIWSLGPEIVGGAEIGAKTFLGKLVAAHGEEIVAEALSSCAIAQPGVPRPWLLKACEAKAKHRDSKHGASVDLIGDDKPQWATRAGFANRFEAGNEGCFVHNASEFAHGRRQGVSA